MKEVIFYRSSHQQRSPGLPRKPVLRSLPAAAYFRPAGRAGGRGRILRPAQRSGHRRDRLDVCPGGVPLRSGRLFHVQRHDVREVPAGIYPIRTAVP